MLSLTIDFLAKSTKTGECKKSEDGEFPPTEGSPYVLLTHESCDSYRKTIYELMISLGGVMVQWYPSTSIGTL